jgi:hypothetical protein
MAMDPTLRTSLKASLIPVVCDLGSEQPAPASGTGLAGKLLSQRTRNGKNVFRATLGILPGINAKKRLSLSPTLSLNKLECFPWIFFMDILNFARKARS